MVVATERDINKALDKYYDGESARASKAWSTDLDDDDELAAAAESLAGDGPIELTSVEAVADSARSASC